MPSIEEEIVTWLNGRSPWQRVLIGHVLAADHNSDGFISDFADKLVANLPQETPKPFKTSELPTTSSTGSKVELVEIRDVVNVNALAEGETLSFAVEGLTVIYGDNGSGKSGYARLVKESVQARHQQRILPNAFNLEAKIGQTATIVYRVDGVEKSVTWPDVEDELLKQIHFHDEACGDDYLVSSTELSYRPSALNMFDTLIKVSDQLRAEIDERMTANIATALQIAGVSDATEAGKFLLSSSGKTTAAEVESATLLPAKSEEQLAAYVTDEARLKGTDQAKEKTRLISGADLVKGLADHLDVIDGLLSTAAAKSLESKRDEAKKLRQAADVASKADFADEPLAGVGSETWRVLWDAAEAYSQAEAYPDEDYPVTSEGAFCALCHQRLSDDAKKRLHRFHNFVHNETARKAHEAEVIVRDAVSDISQLDVTTIATTNGLAFLETEDPSLAETVRKSLETAGESKARIGARLRSESDEPFVELKTIDRDALRVTAESYRTRASKVDAVAFAKQLSEATNLKTELSDRIELAKYRKELLVEVERFRQLSHLKKIHVSLTTQPLTVKSNTLAREYVTQVVDDRFSRESEHLGLERVKLGDLGGDKGKLLHRPALLGATLKGATVAEVLSEGEQTALGLAGLLTEVRFDASKSALVLDDPITSLDHGRRELVAKRIANLASQRQVVVFTHDLTFLGDLVRAANEEGVGLQERFITKDNKHVPGRVQQSLPWKAKDAKKRIGELRERLAKLKKQQANMSPEEYEHDVQLWAGHLSQTWERLVRNDIVGLVVDRGTNQVHPKMVRLLARITDDDNVDFQSGYDQATKWLPRHDRAEEENQVVPTTDQLQTELDRIEAWQKRVASYAKNQ